MSMYNMLFGVNPDTDTLLSLLGKTAGDFGRFRNVYMEDGYIIVHTRNGGGNREDYEDVFDEMSEHPWYSHDEHYLAKVNVESSNLFARSKLPLGSFQQ